MAEAVEFVSADLLLPAQRGALVDEPGVQVPGGLLGGGDDVGELVERGLEPRVRPHLQAPCGGFDPFVQVGVGVEGPAAGRLAVGPRQPAEVVHNAVLFQKLEQGGNRLLDGDVLARFPEAGLETHGAHGDGVKPRLRTSGQVKQALLPPGVLSSAPANRQQRRQQKMPHIRVVSNPEQPFSRADCGASCG